MAGGGDRMRGLAAAGAALLAAGCGGSAGPTAYTVSLPAASFPADQRVATAARLRIVVRNDGGRTLPDVAVSIDSFSTADPRPDLQSPRRPVWLVDRGPGGAAGGGGTTAPETWALGPLAPGATASFLWRVTPVRPGTYRVAYRVAAGSDPSTIAALAGGRPPGGAFTVRVSGAPADPRVDPVTGRVLRRPRPAG